MPLATINKTKQHIPINKDKKQKQKKRNPFVFLQHHMQLTGLYTIYHTPPITMPLIYANYDDAHEYTSGHFIAPFIHL